MLFKNKFPLTQLFLMGCAIMMSGLPTHADEIKVMASVAFKEPYLKRVAQYQERGISVTTVWLPTVEIIKHVVAEDAGDLVIIDRKSIDELTKQGKLRAQGSIDYVSSGIGIGVAKGAKPPLIQNKEDLRNLLLSCRSLAYSTGPSGAYLSKLFEEMGISQQIKSKTLIIQGEPVGNAVKRGDAEIGFQQIPEILSVPEIDLVGPLPADVQYVTTFAFAVPSSKLITPQVTDLIKWLKAPESLQDLRAHGLEPK
jgi:molybdate transport system substrate-binding protein